MNVPSDKSNTGVEIAIINPFQQRLVYVNEMTFEKCPRRWGAVFTGGANPVIGGLELSGPWPDRWGRVEGLEVEPAVAGQ